MTRAIFFVSAFLAAWASPAAAQQFTGAITGAAAAYETDKIVVEGEQIMLWGIDSLDATQHYCTLNNQDWEG